MGRKSRNKKLKRKEEKNSAEIKTRNETGSIYILLMACILFLGSWLLYSDTLDYELVNLDDNKHVETYADFNKDIDNIDDTFTNLFYGNFYRPVLTISYIIDTNVLGSDISDYRISNILLHGLGTVFFFLILIQLRFDRIISFVLSLFFLIHPILTPAVAWIPGRNDSLLAVFIFSSFLMFLKYKEHENINVFYFILHMLTYCIALFTKEVTALFPIILTIYLAFVRKEKLKSKDNLSLFIGWVSIGGIWFFLRHTTLQMIVNAKSEFGLEPFIKNLPTIPALLGKIFVPSEMAGISSFDSFSIISGVIAILLISALAIYFRNKTDRKAEFGLIWFLLFMLPPLFYRLSYVEGFMDYAEHRAYVPMLGIAIFIGELLRKTNAKKYRKIIFPVSGLVIIALLWINLSYQPKFSDRISYWGHNVHMYPDKPRAYSDLSIYFYEKENYWKAKQLLRTALKIDNDEPYCNFNLGKVYLKQKILDSAEKYLSIAVDKDVKNDWSIDYGTVFLLKKDYKKALSIFENALEKSPNNANLLVNIGAASIYLKKDSDAIQYWNRAIKNDKRVAGAYNNLIRIYKVQKKFNDLNRILMLSRQNKIKLEPDVIKIVNNLNN